MKLNYRALQEHLRSKEGQEQLLDWLAHPLTQQLLAASREIARPRPRLDGESAEYVLGLSLGAHAVIDFLTSPISQREGDGGLPSSVLPSYGSDEILGELMPGLTSPAAP